MKSIKMINLIGQQLTKTLIHLGNLLCIYIVDQETTQQIFATLKAWNFEGLGWSIFCLFIYNEITILSFD